MSSLYIYLFLSILKVPILLKAQHSSRSAVMCVASNGICNELYEAEIHETYSQRNIHPETLLRIFQMVLVLAMIIQDIIFIWNWCDVYSIL